METNKLALDTGNLVSKNWKRQNKNSKKVYSELVKVHKRQALSLVHTVMRTISSDGAETVSLEKVNSSVVSNI